MEAMDFDPETLLTSTSSDPMLGKPADQPPASSHEQQSQQSAPSGSFIVLQSGSSPGGGGSSGGVTQLGNISVSSLAPGQGARAAASRLTAVMGRAAGSAPGSLTKFIISPGQAVSSAPVRMLGTSSAVRVAAPTQLQPGTPGTITLSAAQAAQMGILSPRKLATMDGGRPAAVGLASPKRIVVRSSPQGKLQGSVAAAAAAGTGSAAVAQPYRVLTQNTLQQQVANANRAQQGVQFVRVMGTAAGQTVYSAPHTVQSSHPAPATVTAQPTAVKIAIAPGGRAPAQGQRLLLPAGPISGTGTGTAAGAAAMSSMAGADMMRSSTSGAEYGRPRPMMHAPRMNRPATTTNRAQKASSVHLARAAARGGAGDNATQIRPRKPCNCTKSQCLKLYCDCFASGEFCNNCNCTNCFNSLDREEERQRAIRACLDRNPFAFKPKIGKSDNETRKHQKGCNCKKSGCLKNYCECYEAKIFCSSQCKCMGCKNYESANTRPPRSGSAVSALDDSLSLLPGAPEPSSSGGGGGGGGPSGRGTRRAGGLKVATFPATERAPAAVRVTQDVISATLSCLMTEAAGGAIPTGGAAGQDDTAAAQRRVLREFGRCLSEIIGYGTRRQESAVPGLV